MPATMWTPTALASEYFAWHGSGWRAVEAQHRVVSMRLAGGRLPDQAVLEAVLDEAKPPVPGELDALHWLLATPFRYRPLVGGSRFRSADDPGVLYGAEDRQTACAEAGYWRLCFWLDSEGLAAHPASLELTLFEFHGASPRLLDLTREPLSAHRALWTDPGDYRATQALAVQARAAAIGLLRYESARRPTGICLAVLTPAVFRAVPEPYRHQQQTWHLWLAPPHTVVWQRHLDRESFSFHF
ncbi:MAG: RES family NAD+ phosphorylase [Gammaproteobacteria bacterium]|nr:RES family NAD+ phosphorylase [Gammaproteobacteria bacterium]